MDVDAKFLVFLPLFEIDEKGHTQGKLAERWNHSEDYRSWTFHIRQDVKWHDGVPFTAHDIKFTLELISSPEILYDDSWIGMQSVMVHDDYSLTITFESPKDFRSEWLVYWPKHILENLDPQKYWEWDFWTNPVGNGPYRYVRHIPQTMMEFKANEDYFEGEPEIKRVILKFSPVPSLTELLSGNVDVITFFNRSDIPKLAKHPQFQIFYAISSFYSLSAIHWNLNDPLFSDPRVRRAMTLAIDRQEIHRTLNMPEDLKIFDVLFTPYHYMNDEIPAPLPFDQEAAKKLLYQAGWRMGEKGIRRKSGRDFRFEMSIPPDNEAMGSYAEAAVLIQSQLKKMGIHMDIQNLEQDLLNQRILSARFQAAINWFYQGPIQLLKWFGEDSPLGYSNPRMIQLLQDYKNTVDPEEVKRIFGEIMPIMEEDLPMTFLFLLTHTCVADRRIKGLSSPYRAQPVYSMEHLWIEED
jgi:peptide/nickel transport system substrate-binding protein